MTQKNKITKLALAVLFFAGIAGCQKMERPALGDYAEDYVTVPSTPLRFFLNFDSTSEEAKQINIRFADSISGYPSFFPDKSITYGTGVHGTDFVNGSENALQYYNANDFAAVIQFYSCFLGKDIRCPTISRRSTVCNVFT